jgi:carbamoylphosphate synthase small subunit
MLFALSGRANLNSAIQEGRGQLSSELNQHHVPALSQINTRQLTLHLREKGTPWGILVTEPDFLKLGQEKILKLIADHKNSIDSDWVYHVSQVTAAPVGSLITQV